jgi:PAS domain S-box-containing protein
MGRIALGTGLMVFSALVVLFTGAGVPLPGPLIIPDDLARQDQILFIALLVVPTILAAGFSGPVMACLVGAFTGFVLAYFSVRNPFAVVIHGALGLFLAVFLRQRYRTPFFTALRRPVLAGLAVAAVYPLLFVSGVFLGPGDEILVRLNFAFGLLLPEALSIGGSLLIAGIAGGAAMRLFPDLWGGRSPLAPSPAETSLETRSFQLVGLFIAAAVLTLSVVGWAVAYGSASGLIRSRMAGSAELAAQSLPNALETGQSLIQIYLSDERLNNEDPGVALSALDEKLGTGLYFYELMLIEADGSVFAETAAPPARPLSQAETSGVVLASEGVPFQYYSSEASAGGTPAVISFIAPVPGSDRVLVGRSLLAENPFITPLLENMQNLGDIEGRGILIDEAGLILHHPVSEMVSTRYAGSTESEDGFSVSVTPDGRPALVYSVPVDGRTWRVLVQVPLTAVQGLAFNSAAPFVVLLVFLGVASLASLRFVLRVVTGSLRSLALQATEIAETRAGISAPIDISGVDEVGRMRAAFERMRASLKARMDEQGRLLEASQGAASSLEFSQAVKPVLGAALSTGADSVRVVLAPGRQPDLASAEPRAFGAGPGGNRFAYLDDQVLRILESEPVLVVRNPVAHAGLSFGTGNEIPATLAGVALRHDKAFVGAIWLGYANRHTIAEDEVRFLTALAAQASLAVANTSLFRSVQVGRERLAAILASTPDPILVTDHENRLFLANLAAVQVLGGRLEQGEGRPIDELLVDRNLIELIRSDPDEKESVEVEPASGGYYVARVTAFMFRGERFGKVCILRDITRYKELDTVKSELVENVGHDLEQPLTLILGYTTMLPLLGDLNDQQKGIMDKIGNGAERMRGMIKNLVSMGKIEAGIGLEIVELSLVDLAIRIVQEQQPHAIRKNVGLSLAPPSMAVPPILGDENLLTRALGNLVDNAIKYSDDNGTVLLSFTVYPDRRFVRLSIKDNGIGIALPDQDRLFERFFRGTHPERRKRHGTGLGLAIVKSVIESHGGRVWVESIPDVGSTFHVELPEAQAAPVR